MKSVSGCESTIPASLCPACDAGILVSTDGGARECDSCGVRLVPIQSTPTEVWTHRKAPSRPIQAEQNRVSSDT